MTRRHQIPKPFPTAWHCCCCRRRYCCCYSRCCVARGCSNQSNISCRPLTGTVFQLLALRRYNNKSLRSKKGVIFWENQAWLVDRNRVHSTINSLFPFHLLLKEDFDTAIIQWDFTMTTQCTFRHIYTFFFFRSAFEVVSCVVVLTCCSCSVATTS